MDLGLSNDLAVIVGGANGIGKAIADEFGREGASVAVLDLDPRASEIGDGRRFGLTVDVTDYDALVDAQRAVAEWGRRGADHVVYAAGCGSGKYGFPFWNLSPQDWPRVVQVNLLGAVNTAHAFKQSMIERQSGTLLFLSSIAGQIGSQTDPPYSAAKAGLINFAQCAAKDLAPFNVRVNTVCPGMVKTDVNRSVWQAWQSQQPAGAQQSYEDWAEEKIRRTTPLGRWQEAADVAAMAVFLASGRCANVTGQAINVDGGMVMHW